PLVCIALREGFPENKKTPSSVKGRRSCSRYHLYAQVKINLALKFDNGFHIRFPLLNFHGNCSEVTFKCLFMKTSHHSVFSLKCTHILLSSSTHQIYTFIHYTQAPLLASSFFTI